jgi:hypothetical protein
VEVPLQALSINNKNKYLDKEDRMEGFYSTSYNAVQYNTP